MNRSRVVSLFGNTAMTPSEMKLGRFLRAPEGHDAGGGGAPPPPPPSSPAPPANNGGGNQGDSSATGSGDANNSGHGVNLDTFWQQPGGDGTGSPDSAASGSSSSGPPANQGDQSSQGSEFGKRLAAQIDALSFPLAFTPEITAQVAEGKLEGVNGALQNMGKETVKQSLTLSAQLMGRFGEGLISKVESMIQEALGNRDSNETLLESFPSARDPRARPLIESVFKQAMVHTGNDRTKAVALAKDMLKLVGKTAADDLGLQTPPPNGEDTFTGSGPSRLVEELLSRS